VRSGRSIDRGIGAPESQRRFSALKRVSPALRLYTGVEGVEDEIEWITEAQLFLRRNVFLKLNNAIGLTSKATDWAPEIGIMFSF
jgi:hypothetical protein